MARRNQLKGVAHGLLGTFISRYNDINGFWALGVLRSLSEDLEHDPLEIELVRKSSSPESPVLSKLANTYYAKLEQLLTAQNLPAEWVSEVKLSIKFSGIDEDSHSRENFSYGQPYVCHINLKSDLGKSFSSTKSGWCRRHL